MSVTQSYPFNDQADYNISNVEVTGGLAKLLLTTNPGLLFSESFNSATGFTYDSTKAEFVSNLLRQKDQTVNATLTNATNAVIATNNVTKNAGGAAWNAGAATSASFASGDGEIKYNVGTNNTDSIVGLTTLANPLGIYSNINFGVFCAAGGNFEVYELGVSKGIFGTYLTTDTFTVAVESGAVKYKKNGTTFYTSLVTPTYPLYGGITIFTVGLQIQNITTLFTSRYFESKADLPNFIYSDIGYIQALTLLAVTEVGSPRYIIEGKYWNGSAWTTSNNSYAQSSSLATINTNFASLSLSSQTVISVSVTLPDGGTLASVDALSLTYTGQKYPASGYLEPISGLDTASLVDYFQSVSLPTDTQVRVILKIDGVLTWWSGSAWVESDGSEGESNSEDEIDSNLSALDLGANSDVVIRWLLLTEEDQETPELTESIVEYEFGAVETEPDKCIVFGYYRDIAGNPISGASVTFSLVRSRKEYIEANNNVIEGSVTVTTDVNGYFSTNLIRSSEYANGGVYQVVIQKSSASLYTSKNPDKTKLTFEVPDSTTKDITDLLPTVA